MTRSLLIAFLLVPAATAQMRITEWQYNGDEYVEFTNVGATPIDMNGWSFDDDSRTPGSVSLSALGIVPAGRSVILCEATAAAFATSWRLTGVTIVGGSTANLGRNDEINLYDASQGLVDRLTFGDQTIVDSIRTADVSGSPCVAAVGQNDVYGWSLVFVGDGRGTVTSINGHLGNPGTYVPADARLLAYGLGCPGSNSTVPELRGRGCPTPNGQALLSIANGLFSAPAALLVGAGRTSLPFGACVVHTLPIVMVPVTLDGTGRLALRLPVPATVGPADVHAQVFVVDAGAVDGFSATNGLEILVR